MNKANIDICGEKIADNSSRSRNFRGRLQLPIFSIRRTVTELLTHSWKTLHESKAVCRVSTVDR